MKNKTRKICLIVGLIIGALADGILRLLSGDKGNLLVHSVVFLAGAFVAYLVVYVIQVLVKRKSSKKSGCNYK